VKVLEVAPHVEPFDVREVLVGRRRDVRRPGHLREHVPRDAGEERVGPDLVGAAGVPEPPPRVPLQQARDEIRELRRPPPGVPRELELLLQHVPERLLAVLALERRPPERHLVGEHADGPPVDGEAVALAAHHLWRHVLLRADEGVGLAPRGGGGAAAEARGLPAQRRHPRRLALPAHPGPVAAPHDVADQALELLPRRRRRGPGLVRGPGVVGVGVRLDLLAENRVAPRGDARPAAVVAAGRRWPRGRRRLRGRPAGVEEAGQVEVGERDVAVGAEEHVLGLEVAVHDARGVELGDRGDDLGNVEADGRGGEDAVGERVAELVEVAAGAVRDGPREKVVRLGEAEERGEVRVRKAGQHADLPPRAAVGVRLPAAGGGALVEDLEGVAAGAQGRGPLRDEEHGAHGAAAEDAQRARPVEVDVHVCWPAGTGARAGAAVCLHAPRAGGTCCGVARALGLRIASRSNHAMERTN
jgi:hypothetical protein